MIMAPVLIRTAKTSLMHESTDESQSEPTALEPIESQKTVTWMEPVKTIIPMEPNEPQH